MESVDRLLAELKAKHDAESQGKRSEETVRQTDSSPAKPIVTNLESKVESKGSATARTSSALPQPPTSLDELLGRLGEDKKRSIRTQLSLKPPRSTAQLLSSQPSTFSPSVPALRAKADVPEVSRSSPKNSKLLADLKAQYQAKDEAIAQQRHQEETEALRRAEVQRAEQRQALVKRAEDWLKQINVDSEEGLWFEEFAYNYDSRLEAAIEYLDALGQSV